MYISYNWLKDFLKISARVKPEEIAEQLTSHTVEVEGIEKQASRFDQVVVGKVLEVKKHPNADRLRVTVVDVKTKKLTIVCGAPNVEVGQLVAVALVGAVLPNGLTIQAAEIRGEASQGMICAEDELALGSNHEGIMVLNNQAKVGEAFAKYLQADDIILEVDNKSLSNRPDLWSHYGIARELQAIFGWSLKPYDKLLGKSTYLSDKENKLEVKIEDKELCPRYQAVKIDNLKVSESPAWLKNRLIAAHQRPINNIVDLTNYVMLECGQPLHAFDAVKVKKILVRRADKNEIIETLDGKECSLNNDDLVITNGQEAIAIAGVMGGKNSEISETTTSIILEAANFQATAIRKTAQKFSLRSEASMRFEKSLDPTGTEVAIRRFLTLLKDVAPGFKITSALIDVNNSSQSEIIIALSLPWLTAKIGQEIASEQVYGILEKLGFKIEKNDEENWQVTVPSWRATKDIKIKEDLVEEVLRLYGYDNIISRLPVQTLSLPENNQSRGLERQIKNLLANKYCLNETYNYSFVNEEQLKKLNIDFFNHLKLANPLSDVHTTLRQSLIPGLLANIKNNQAKSDNLDLFEIGSVFFNAQGNFKKDAAGLSHLPYQEKRLAMVLSSDKNDSFRRLKGLVASLLVDVITISEEAEFSALEDAPGWADQRWSAKIIYNNQVVGLIAQVSQVVNDNLNLKKVVAAAEINFNLLTEIFLATPTKQYQEAPKYPVVTRDLAFVIDEKIRYNDFRQAILRFNPLISRVELFDVYVGDKLAVGEKSLAFHLSYQSSEKTLTAVEVDAVQAELITNLAAKFEAHLRSL